MSDCMTREDAERMGASQAVQILKPLQAMMLDQYGCPISAAYFALDKAIEALKQQPVDAVPVVRCEDCKWYDKHDKRCKVWNHGVLSIGYCYRGEEREDETAD